MIDAALDYVDRGFFVFPCAEKRPITDHGFHDASAEPAQVAAWWTQHPDAWIGFPIPSGWVVLDVDPRNGGDDTLRGLIDLVGASRTAFTRTRKARTRSGGLHFYFTRVLDEDSEFTKTAGPGVDVRAPGKGYVIAPPSPGYAWIVDGPPEPLPLALVDVVTRPAFAAESSDGLSVGVDLDVERRFFPFEDGTAYGLKALAAEAAEMEQAAEGTRNRRLNEAAFAIGQLVAGGELDEDFALDAILNAALNAGLSQFEAVGTLRSGFRAGALRPRSGR